MCILCIYNVYSSAVLITAHINRLIIIPYTRCVVEVCFTHSGFHSRGGVVLALSST